jgi:hypothetical protein
MINKLIDQINPIYNEYRENRSHIAPNLSICLMYDIGDFLNKYLSQNDIKPHNLYRKIYGRSEGSFDNTKKSYITREFLGRCFRIRNMFSDKEEIMSKFPSLGSFTNFRESMPFFDNDKYKFEGDELNKLLSLLNSDLSNKKIHSVIKKLQKDKIGIKNDRKQRLNDYDVYKKSFVDFYNKVYKIKLEGEKASESDLYMKLSKNLSAMCSDGIQYTPIEIPKNIDEIDRDFCEMIDFFTSRKTFVEIRRFRKVIDVNRFSILSEYLYEIAAL